MTAALYCVGEELENLVRTNKQTVQKLRPPYPQVSSRETRANNITNKWQGLALGARSLYVFLSSLSTKNCQHIHYSSGRSIMSIQIHTGCKLLNTFITVWVEVSCVFRFTPAANLIVHGLQSCGSGQPYIMLEQTDTQRIQNLRPL